MFFSSLQGNLPLRVLLYYSRYLIKMYKFRFVHLFFYMDTIKITNQQNSVIVDIEGVIGVPEEWQFDSPDQRVATYDKFRNVVEDIKNINAEEVIVNIRSTGGDVNDALLIYDALCSLSARVITRCYGYVASAATVIAQAASKGAREISPNALYLIHKSHTTVEGNAIELEAKIQLLRQTDERLADLYANRSGKDSNEFANLMNEANGEGRWLSATETINAGLADVEIEQIHNNINEKTKHMIKNIYSAIRKVLNIAPDADDVPIEEGHVEQLNEALRDGEQQLQEKDTALQAAQSELEAERVTRENLESQLGEVTNRAELAETELARFKALPTETKAVEDPTVDNEAKLTPRSKAYEDDAKRFCQ